MTDQRTAVVDGTRRQLAVSKWAEDHAATHIQSDGGHHQSETTDASGWPELQQLIRFLLFHGDQDSSRPKTGASIALTIDEGDCDRTRIALRRLSTERRIPREIELAAISLEIALECPLNSVRSRKRSVTLEFDVADCVLMALALLCTSSHYRGHDEAPDAYLQQGRKLLARIERSTPEQFDTPSIAA